MFKNKSAINLKNNPLFSFFCYMQWHTTGSPHGKLREGDILTMDWSSGDVVYVSSICFPDSLLQVSVTTVELIIIMTRNPQCYD